MSIIGQTKIRGSLAPLDAVGSRAIFVLLPDGATIIATVTAGEETFSALCGGITAQEGCAVGVSAWIELRDDATEDDVIEGADQDDLLAPGSRVLTVPLADGDYVNIAVTIYGQPFALCIGGISAQPPADDGTQFTVLATLTVELIDNAQPGALGA